MPLSLKPTERAKAVAAGRLPKPVVPNTPTKDRTAEVDALLDGWCATYPKVFNATTPLPLAEGVHKQLRQQATTVPWKTFRLAMYVWCNRPQYLEAMLATDAQRHSLDGQPTGPVSAEHKDYAMYVWSRRYV